MTTYKGRAVTDLVVVVPGIMGSRLEKDGTEVWGTTMGRLLINLLNFGRTVRSGLAIPADVVPDCPNDGVSPSGLITGLTVIPGLLTMDFYDGLRRNLRHDLELTEGQLVDFAYDWRLSCRVNGERLTTFLDAKIDKYRRQSGRKELKAILICHSMGGLVARWCVDRAAGADLVSSIVTIGTPHKGSILALDAVANGVRLPRHLGIDLTEMALSFPSLYELLPTYSCVHLDGSQRKPLTSDDVTARIAALCPAELNDVQERIGRGLKLHTDLAAAAPAQHASEYELVCFRGAEQPTPVATVLGNAGLVAVETIDGIVHGGDGVVPGDSGVPPQWSQVGAAKGAGGRHASMPNGKALREELRVTLRHTGRLMAPPIHLSMRAPAEVLAGQAFDVELRPIVGPGGRVPELNLALSVEPQESALRTTRAYHASRAGDTYRASVEGLPPGLYRLRVDRGNTRARDVDDLTDGLVVYDGS